MGGAAMSQRWGREPSTVHTGDPLKAQDAVQLRTGRRT
jgi:hypothetical protein